jgi:hypothetical protein
MIKYKANRSSIKNVEIISETKEFVVIGPVPYYPRGFREKKQSPDHIYCDTWQEAHDWLLGKAQDRFESAVKNLDYAEAALSKAKEMKNEMVD